jgi:hypothetical protein
MAAAALLTPQQIADRLAQYSTRLRTGSITRAKALWTVWRSYNDAQNPLRDEQLPRHLGAPALNILVSAALHESMMIIVRAFDQRGHRNLFQTDKVSFPIMAELTEQPGVRAELEIRARNWLEGWQAEENARACLDSLDRMEGALERLATEAPNRQQLLRDFRDEFLAHNLEIEAERARPFYAHITGLLEELTTLSDHAELAYSGLHVHWDVLQDQYGVASAALWQTIRNGAQVGR